MSDYTAKQGKDEKPTDDLLAVLWLSKFPNTAYGLGHFRRYKDGVWDVVPLDTVKAEVVQVLVENKAAGIRPTEQRMKSTLELARVMVSLPSEIWDNEPDYLPCKNGALHIPTLTLHPHSPDFHFTTRLDYDYDPKATCPIFTKVLNTTIPASKNFLQQFAGYALTTDTSFEIAIWLYGMPGGGKSTILAGFEAMLGPRVGVVGLGDIERSRFALTNITGKTLLIASENPASYLRATYYLNAIISGEAIEIDKKFRDPVLIIPRAKIAWSMNTLPQVGEAENGLFRRVKVIPFPPLPEAQRDPAIKEAVKQEGPGILNWALKGLASLKKLGHFEIPDSVLDATQNFQKMNDVEALFVAEMCTLSPEYQTQAQFLYNTYKLWCLDNGHKPKSSTTVAEDWRRLGFVRHKADGRSWWRGVMVRVDRPA